MALALICAVVTADAAQSSGNDEQKKEGTAASGTAKTTGHATKKGTKKTAKGAQKNTKKTAHKKTAHKKNAHETTHKSAPAKHS